MAIMAESVKTLVTLSEKSGFLKSKSEATRELKGNSISVNKQKINDTYTANESDLIDGKFLLLQKGKKNYYLLTLEA